MGAIRTFKRFRELLDVDWANISDGQYIKRNGSLLDGGTPAGGGASTDWSVRNTTGSTLTKGTPVYEISYDSGNSKPLVGAADGSDSAKAQVVGVVQSDISNNSNGTVQTYGELSGLDTSAWAEGTELFAYAGALTEVVQPYSRAVGFVIYSHASSGIIYIYPSMPTLQLGGSGAGAMFPLLSGSLPAADSELVIPEFAMSYWNSLIIELHGYRPATDATDVKVAFQAGGSDITGSYAAVEALSTYVPVLSAQATTGTDSTVWFANLGNGSDEGLIYAKIELVRNVDGVQFGNLLFGHKKNSSGTTVMIMAGQVRLVTATQATGLRLFQTSGNIAEVTYNVWGVKAAS